MAASSDGQRADSAAAADAEAAAAAAAAADAEAAAAAAAAATVQEAEASAAEEVAAAAAAAAEAAAQLVADAQGSTQQADHSTGGSTQQPGAGAAQAAAGAAAAAAAGDQTGGTGGKLACEASGMCSVGRVKRYWGEVTTNEQLRTMLEGLAYKKEVSGLLHMASKCRLCFQPAAWLGAASSRAPCACLQPAACLLECCGTGPPPLPAGCRPAAARCLHAPITRPACRSCRGGGQLPGARRCTAGAAACCPASHAGIRGPGPNRRLS